MSVRRRMNENSRTGRWVVDIDFAHPDGRKERVRRTSPVQTRRGAEEFERQLREALLTGERGKHGQVPLFAAFADEVVSTYAVTNNKPSELESKRQIVRMHLVPAFGKLRLDELSAQLVERFKAKQVELGLKPKTINNHLTVLRTIMGLAVEWGKIERLPTIKRLRVPRPKFDFLSFDEAEQLVAAARGESEWQSMVIVAINTGLRLGELLALEWEDLNGDTLVVRRSNWHGHIGTPKSGRERIVDLNSSAANALRRQRHLRGPLVWCRPGGHPYATHHLQAALRRIRRRAGLRPFEWHVLRHTFASHLAMRGVALKAVQELLGHSSMEMTMRYAHLSPGVRRDAVDLLVRPVGVDSGTMATLGTGESLFASAQGLQTAVQ